MKVKPPVCIITAADVYLHAVTGTRGKQVQVRCKAESKLCAV